MRSVVSTANDSNTINCIQDINKFVNTILFYATYLVAGHMPSDIFDMKM